MKLTAFSIVFFATILPNAGIAMGDPPIDPAIRGIWFCTEVNGFEGYRVTRNVLILRDQEFMVVAGTGLTRSRVNFIPSSPLNAIDIERYDGGLQKGVYRHEGDELKLTLSDPGVERPDHIDYQSGQPLAQHSHYTFKRVPTAEGLKVLHRALGSDDNRRLMMESDRTVEVADNETVSK